MNEIKNKLIYNDKESKLYIPNEIFDDLKASGVKNKHIPLAYTYYYLISWLYRYTKYQTGTAIDNKMIKQILGYSPTYPEIDYVIKKNGVLDQIGYTITDKDIPLSWTYEDGYLEFEYLSDMDEDIQKIVRQMLSRKYTVKFPVKAFHRTKESEEDNCYDGTFYDISNTHLVEFEVFMFCMSKENIGCTGFYLWSYLKMQSQIHGGYDVSLDDLSKETSIERRTLIKYMKMLREHRMINCCHNQEYFCLGLSQEEKKANTYSTNDWFRFSERKQEIDIIKVISVKKYEKLKEDKGLLADLYV